MHPLGGEEIRALRRVKREAGESRYVFVTERNGPMTAAGFRKKVEATLVVWLDYAATQRYRPSTNAH
jgi:hypothetical protein